MAMTIHDVCKGLFRSHVEGKFCPACQPIADRLAVSIGNELADRAKDVDAVRRENITNIVDGTKAVTDYHNKREADFMRHQGAQLETLRETGKKALDELNALKAKADPWDQEIQTLIQLEMIQLGKLDRMAHELEIQLATALDVVDDKQE